MAAEESNAEKEYIELCRNGDLEGVKASLLAGVDVNTIEPPGGYMRTGLVLALINSHNDVVQHLLNTENLNVHLKDGYRMTALHAAVQGNNHEGLAMLLDFQDMDELDVNARDKYRRTPLWRAIENCSEHCIKMLLRDERVDPNIEGTQGPEYAGEHRPLSMQDDLLTPLLYAVKRGLTARPLLRLLLSNPRTDPNIKDHSNWSKTALMYAVKENKEDIVQILLADPRVDLDTTERFERKADDIAR